MKRISAFYMCFLLGFILSCEASDVQIYVKKKKLTSSYVRKDNSLVTEDHPEKHQHFCATKNLSKPQYKKKKKRDLRVFFKAKDKEKLFKRLDKKNSFPKNFSLSSAWLNRISKKISKMKELELKYEKECTFINETDSHKKLILCMALKKKHLGNF